MNIWSAKADYEATVLNFARLEAGAKWALSKTGNTTVKTETGPSAVNSETRFKYRENIGACLPLPCRTVRTEIDRQGRIEG